MKLSIVIVNYNVRHFLEQCLYSVYQSLAGIEAEVIVVDNNSVDGSEGMIRSKFERVILVVNKQNVGFARANNQGLQLAQGEYVLVLNPDTVVEESTFAKCLSFMDARPEAGSLGPKMIDGKGNFLPESKRGLPTPRTAFYKIFGLTGLFPHSKRFAPYYLGHTSIDATQEVDILTGAFMLIRKRVLGETGYFDEQFFMYGEDIDLSYRIVKAGYKNYYFPETTIIHYKGESTRKGSLNYVKIFYRAMQIFAQKHFTGKMAESYSLFINLAIYFRAALSLLKRSVVKSIPMILDAAVSYGGCYVLTTRWAMLHFGNRDYYSPGFLSVALSLFVFILLLGTYFSGGYRSPLNLWKACRGIAYGAIVVLVVYALLPSDYRFSRAVIVFGTVWALLAIVLVRVLLSTTGYKDYQLDLKKKRRFAIVGLDDEATRVEQLLRMSNITDGYIVHVSPGASIPSEYYSGNIDQLRDVIAIHSIDEVIFCARDVASKTIIENMKMLTDTRVNFKIASPDSISVIGSNSTHTAGDLYVVNINLLHPKAPSGKHIF
jgi:O-antigen biosynthesis protein